MLKSLSVVFVLSASGAAMAQSDMEDITYFSCHICHDAAGVENPIPVIRGQPYEDLLEKLNGFDAGPDNSTIMHRFVAGFSEAEIENMARFISNLESSSK